MTPRAALAAITPLCLLLAACGSTPPMRYYTLGPLPPAPASSPAANGASLVVGPVSVPAAVDRLQLVRETGGAHAEVSDEHRWAAPLKTEVARRVAVEVARRTPYARAVPWPQSSLGEPDFALPIDIVRFEAEGFGRVTLGAVWSLRQHGQAVVSRRFAATETIQPADWNGLAAAHGRLVDALAADIAAALPARP